MINSLSPENLCKKYRIGQIPDDDGTPIAIPPALIGQERALRALKFGLDHKVKDFHLYVAGHPVKDKLEAIRAILDVEVAKLSSPPDWCYVPNFSNPNAPKAIKLPSGSGQAFQQDLKVFAEDVQKSLMELFDTEEFIEKRANIVLEIEEKERQLQEEIGEKALTPKWAKQKRLLERESKEKIQQLQENLAQDFIDVLSEEWVDKYKSVPGAQDHFKALGGRFLNNLNRFISYKTDRPSGNWPPKRRRSKEYDINLLVAHEPDQGVPIIWEPYPTYARLFGCIEKPSGKENASADFSGIRAGALHKANGGYLILPAEALYEDEKCWAALKRALFQKEIRLEEQNDTPSPTSSGILPAPIPLDIKLILIGSHRIFYVWPEWDSDFNSYFKVFVDFDESIESHLDHLNSYINIFYDHCRKKAFPTLSKEAVCRLLEYAHYLAEHQNRLYANFNVLTAIIEEAAYYCGQKKQVQISSAQVGQAIAEQRYRLLSEEEDGLRMIREGTLLMNFQGEKIGEINSLLVYETGELSFGHPVRLTSSISVGKEGILHIEREVKLSGNIHSKAVLIFSGYLQEAFGRDKSISLTAQLVFEQSYSEIDGDSASSAELYCLLSALANVPVKQGIAVTGSINQKGEIQAIGGVNEKIQGFFGICKATGLTGQQGVLIPHSNIINLQSSGEVVEAVQNKQFHIWPVKTVEEGIEVLTGMKAGKIEWDASSGKLSIEPDSLFEKVNERLKQLHEMTHDEYEENENDEEEEDNKNKG